jgi:hypothetical protein
MTITGLQVHYTACRRGQASGSGFQIRALTPGISPDEQREVQQRGSYKRPRNSPDNPTVEQLDTDFPRAFGYYTLASGRWAMVSSSYAATETGRGGNFFAHTLVVDGGLASTWPIDYYEWEGWKRRLAPGEDTDDAPPPLERVSVADIPPSPSFSVEELQAFLRETPGRAELLPAMIRAAFVCRRDSRPIVIRDTALNGAFWIACIQKAFPVAHARQLTFSTYQHSPSNGALLNATTEGTDFACDETQRRFKYYVFDLLGGAHSEVPAEGSSYADTVARWMTEEPARLEEFHEFTRLFTHDAIAPELELGVRLFELARVPTPPTSDESLTEALRFAALYGTRAGRAALLPAFSQSASRALRQSRDAEVEAILAFWVESVQPLDGDTDIGLLVECYSGLIEGLFANQRWGALDTFQRSRAKLAGLGASVATELGARLLAEPRLASLCQALEALRGNAAAMSILLAELEQAVGTLPDASARRTITERVLASAAVAARQDHSICAALLATAGADAGRIVELCRRLDGAEVPDGPAEVAGRHAIVGAGLAQTLARHTPGIRQAVHRGLDVPEMFPLLLAEWRSALLSQGTRRVRYGEYFGLPSSSPSQFLGQHRSDVARAWVDALPPEERQLQAAEWLSNGEIDGFGSELAHWCVEAVNGAIRFELLDAAQGAFATQILERARQLRLDLRPNRALILLALARGALAPGMDERALKDALRQLDAHECRHALRLLVPPCLAGALDVASQARVIGALRDRDWAEQFDAIYLSGLQQAKPAAEWLAAALCHWLEAPPSSPEGTSRQHALDALGAQLEAAEEDRLEAVRRIVEACLQPASRQEWASVLAAAEQRRRSLFRRIFRRNQSSGVMPRKA